MCGIEFVPFLRLLSFLHNARIVLALVQICEFVKIQQPAHICCMIMWKFFNYFIVEKGEGWVRKVIPRKLTHRER